VSAVRQIYSVPESKHYTHAAVSHEYFEEKCKKCKRYHGNLGLDHPTIVFVKCGPWGVKKWCWSHSLIHKHFKPRRDETVIEI